MPRLAANLSTLYGELPVLERAAAARADGFEAVECQFPYAQPLAEWRVRLADAGVPLVLLNAPPGDWAAGERGLAALPGRDAEFRASIDTALHWADRLGCPCVHVLAGWAPPGIDPGRLHGLYIDNLGWAAAQAAGAGIDLLIEPINRRDMPGYFLHRQDQAHEVLAQVGSLRLKVQMDLYHCQVAEGDVATKLRRYLPTGRVGHLQIAGAPERHEPDVGELNHRYLFDVIDALGYTGWIGCEYHPRGSTRAGLGWRG